jgi:hypothetical protein
LDKGTLHKHHKHKGWGFGDANIGDLSYVFPHATLV